MPKSTTFPTATFVVIGAALLTEPSAVLANGVGENAAWQFETTQDKVNRAYLENLRQQKISGYYKFVPPVYNTTIDRQYNCSVSAASTGNSASSSASGASQGANGTSASSIGNTSATDQFTGTSAAKNVSATDQQNTGQIGSSAQGNVDVRANVDATQALNTDQNNSGNQSSSVSGSTSCQFGLLN